MAVDIPDFSKAGAAFGVDRKPMERMREALQVLLGTRGDPLDAALTLRTAMDRGLIDKLGRALVGNTTIINNNPGTGTGGGGTYTPDLTPPPDVTGLAVVAGFSQVIVTFNAPTYTQGHGHKQTHLYAVKRDPSDPAMPTFQPGVTPRVFTAVGPLTVVSLPSELNTRWHIWAKYETVDGVESVNAAGGINGAMGTTGQDIAQLVELLTGQITRSQLYSDLGSKIDLIDGPQGMPGSVNARLKAEADARALDIQAEVLARSSGDTNTLNAARTYTDNFTYSTAGVNSAIAAQATILRAEFAAADDTGLNTARAYTESYSYSRAAVDSGIAGVYTNLRAEFAGADSTVLASAQNYTNSYAYAKGTGEALATQVSGIQSRTNRVKNYRLASWGLSATAGEGWSGVRAEDGTQLVGSQRSYCLTVFNGSTGALAWSEQYDVHGNGEIDPQGQGAAELAAALNGLGPEWVVAVTTFDEPRNNRLSAGLDAAMYRCGASRAVFGASNFQHRSAYILVGIPGIGEGQGVEKYVGAVSADPNAWVDYQLQLVNGRPVALGGNSTAAALSNEITTRTSLTDAFAGSIGTLQAQVNSPNSGNNPTYAALQSEASVRAGETGHLFGQWSVKLDLNGYVSGYGLASTANNAAPTSSFIVRADSFAVASPSGPGIAPVTPFIVRTTVTTENGVTIPVGVYMDAAYIVNLSAMWARFGSLVADSIAVARINAANLNLGDGSVGGNLKSTSFGYGSGSGAGTGWLLAPNGTAYLNNAVVYGTVYASAGVFAGSLSAATGTFAGSLSAATGTFAGSLSAATGSFAGDISAATGSFSGALNVKSAASGARMEITNQVIKVFDEGGNIRVKIGNLAA